MHRVDVGVVGVLAVVQTLIKQGWEVFSPYSHNTRIDLIAVKGSVIKRIQVKTTTEYVNGAIPLYLKNPHPNSNYDYDNGSKEFDTFALYCMTSNTVIFIEADEALQNSTVVMFRIEESNNNQAKNTRLAKDYELLAQ